MIVALEKTVAAHLAGRTRRKKRDNNSNKKTKTLKQRRFFIHKENPIRKEKKILKEKHRVPKTKKRG